MNLTFRTKLLLAMCGIVLLTGVVLIAVADRASRQSTQALVNSLFRQASDQAMTQTRDFVLHAAPVAQSLEQLADKGLALNDLDKLALQLLAFLKANPGMTWVLYGDESGDYTGATRLRDGSLHIERTHIVDGKTHLTEYEVHKDGSWKIVRQDNNSGYDPRTRPFYILAKEKDGLAWTQPYMFFTQNLPGISCVIPVKEPNGQLRGVFSVEFDLNALSEFVANLSLSEHSRVFLFTPDLVLLAHPNERTLIGQGVKGTGEMLTLADTGDPLVNAFRQNLKPEYIHGAKEDFHFFHFDNDGTGYLASTTVFPIGDGQSWVVGAIAPQSDFLAGVWHARWISLEVAGLALCLAAVVAGVMARRISNPVHSLIGSMQRVGAGDLEACPDFHGGREFRQLSVALNKMVADLRERLQLRHSLHVALDVQKSLLPASEPISPLFDIAGRSRHCDETGGDYYDFVDFAPLSSTSLMVAVGDVMGHGIPAAMVMATARAALRTNALGANGLGALMTRTNAVLADNRQNRLMTIALLRIDADTRIIHWASAGHDPSIVYHPRTNSFQNLEGGGPPLGSAKATEYEEYTSEPLSLNSVIVIGTDGIWEIFNQEKKQYGKERLQNLLQVTATLPAAKIASALEADLEAFRGSQKVGDDVTFVIIKLLAATA